MRFLFLFVDGLGLGSDDPLVNPLAAASMPALQAMLGGGRLLRGSLPVDTERATLLALDAGLATSGLPQSATGQAVLLTGKIFPASWATITAQNPTSRWLNSCAMATCSAS